MTRVVVVDDQALVRASFGVLLDTTPGLTVVGEAGDGAEAVDVVTRLRPDVVLMDIRMPRLNGIDATRQVLARVPDVKVLMLTTYDLDEYVYAALRAGASGFLLKDTPPADLLTAIQVIAGGDAILAPQITRRLIREFADRPEPRRGLPHGLAGVTERERDVLLLVAQGLSNTEISERLHISLATTKTHVARLLAKLGARNRIQLVIVAYEAGLMETA
ncbi:response regulator [Actinoplanes utahensis]|uniref:LuxR family transcriptional regulator n=1 Tax=Actinoplanes utahensis TaxID=1869 RepID=A0A0A6X4T2_ACTUT|nr:response regulator transcription factor [Actinoplanes utahensis]KHD75117.1 LuxR family transcriptional regulator [Actinoplanes utahensis]GIF27056.1 DNA-binding response regulator [Actinoplanes utahensis]